MLFKYNLGSCKKGSAENGHAADPVKALNSDGSAVPARAAFNICMIDYIVGLFGS